MIYEFVYKGEVQSLELKEGRVASFPDGSNSIEIECMNDGRLMLRDGPYAREIFAAVKGDKTFVDIDGVLYEFAVPSDNNMGGSVAGGPSDASKVFAPMPGKVVKLMVAVGDAVEPKQQLVIVEAMKMENVIVAQGKGSVKAINFIEGAQCDTDTPIIELEVEG